MARIRDYFQDEDKPFGVGTFLLDDGSEYYMDDAPRARQFLEDIERESTNIAERGSPDRQGERLGNEDRYENAVAKLAGAPEPNRPFRGIETGPSALRRAVAGPGGGDELMSEDDQSRMPDVGMSRAPEEPARPERKPEPRDSSPRESRAPDETLMSEENMSVDPGGDAGPRRALSREELEDQAAAARYAQAAALAPRTTRGTPASALGPGVRVDQSYSRKGGIPMELYQQQAADRDAAFTATNDVIGRQYRENAAATELRAQQLEAQALEQKKANTAAALELQRKQQKYQDDRAWLEKDVDQYYDKSKPDPDRLFKQRGVFGNIAAAIAQFMGAYAAVISGSPNFANQILSKKRDDDIDAQLEEFRRGKMKRDGQLQRMADRGLTLDQMKTALKLQQEMVIQKEIQAAALREGTREAKQAAESMLAKRYEDRVKTENEFQTQALGEETVSGQMVRPTGPRALTPLERQKQINELLGAQVEGDFLARGGAPAERAEERAYKREDLADRKAERAEVRDEKRAARQAQGNQLTEAQAKAESAHQSVSDLAGKAGLVRDRSGKWVVGGGAVPPGLLQKAGETATLGLYQGDIGAAFDAAVEAFGRQQSGGVIGKDERPAFEVQLGRNTFSRAQLANRLNAAELNIEAKRKKDLDEIRSGRVNAAPSYWKNEDEE